MSTITAQNGDNQSSSSKRRRSSSTDYVAVTPGGPDGDGGVGGRKVFKMLKPRAYQEEMLRESLRQNIIVAMDTGSGKTQIAILRIREELERCPRHKLVWFITPTVVLAQQQYNVISEQLPAFQARIITGADNVDHWSSQEIWDAVLRDMRIIVSTPQVLLDALTHAFVQLDRIALLVFDEAHHCTRSAPGRRILADFYHNQLQQSGTTDGLPHILGLTASPTTDGSGKRLRELEQSLNAVCKSPKIHREEMMQYVHRPTLEVIVWKRDMLERPKLEAAFAMILEKNMKIEDDPLVKRLRQRNDEKSRQKLDAALLRGKTVCRKQATACFHRTLDILDELGPWAAETFFAECRRRLLEKCLQLKQQVRDEWMEWDYEDNLYMSNALEKVPITPERQVWENTPTELSDKATRLVDLLKKDFTTGTRAIMFAKERATVVMLAHLISMHPELKHVRPGSFLGCSSFAARKSDIIELTVPADQTDAVNELRTGKKNILISTSVLEEGVDIPACDLVICFDPISNLRSFIQRRGRARKETSKFIVFLDEGDSTSIARWKILEEQIRVLYEDDERARRLAQQAESVVETGYKGLRLPSGAYLTMDNARQHLAHFCNTLSHPFTECQPDFIIIEDASAEYVSAKVVLPSVLDPQFREFYSRCKWKTERRAQQDAAFQAYVKLYEAGLVNDNLMPAHISTYDKITEQVAEKRTGVAKVAPSLNPWAMIAAKWEKTKMFYQSIIEITSDSHSFPRMVMVLPVQLPCDITFKLFWNETTALKVSIKRQPAKFASSLVELAADATYTLFSSIFSSRMIVGRMDFSCLFLPELTKMASNTLMNWIESVKGTVAADTVLKPGSEQEFRKLGLVRYSAGKYTKRPIIAEKCVWMKREIEDDLTSSSNSSSGGNTDVAEELHIEGLTLPKRTDFLHPIMNTTGARLHSSRRCYPVSGCKFDRLPVEYARFTQFVPSILHHIENHFIAQELSETILAPVGFKDLKLILTAISASAAREATDYQRLEFYGDSLLKLHTSLQLAATHPYWHEDLLSRHKDLVVSNTRLSKAALETGLDKFILQKAFTGLKWRPLYNSDHSTSPVGEKTREISTKILADVVEALFGASMIDGGQDKVLKCLQVFLPEVGWIPYDTRVDLLYNTAPWEDERTPVGILSEIEELIGYEFTNKALLTTAFTHPSHSGPGQTYQRLEFVGDAILDSIVVQALFDSPREFPHYQMHSIKTALVNADFLGFLAMTTCKQVSRTEVSTEVTGDLNSPTVNTTISTSTRQIGLYEYMRHSASWDIVNMQQEASERLKECREEIEKALNSSHTYPWTLLCRIGPGKFFSDLIESILGAIFIDSRGSLNACNNFLERIGLMKYLRRVLSEEIEVMHPKERLGMLAGKARLTVNYISEKVEGESNEGGGEVAGLTRWICRVQIGEEDMAFANDATSRIEAETKAAESAIETMSRSNFALRDNMDVESDVEAVDQNGNIEEA
ncbi:hypothetical protein VTO42DRAFT_509 [Malbranchea cinnamomea]